MTFQIRQAERRQARGRIALAGTSGSGKTLSSLLIAYGLVEDWTKIALIDTEQGSGELYEGREIAGLTIGRYQYGRITAPFSPEKYVEAIKACERAVGAGGVVILDSTTHAWAAEGGVLDTVDKLAGRGNKFAAWRDVTPQHNALVEAMLQSPCHIIATIRAKTDYVLEADGNNKMVPKKVGLAPVQRDGFEYEFTVVLDLDANHYAKASKDRTGLFDRQIVLPTPDLGRQFRAWLETGAPDEPPPPAGANGARAPAPAAPPPTGPVPALATDATKAEIREAHGVLDLPTDDKGILKALNAHLGRLITREKPLTELEARAYVTHLRTRVVTEGAGAGEEGAK